MSDDRGPLLDLIRARPALYLSEPWLTALYHFVGGFHFALHTHGLDDAGDFDIPREFNDWVAYRLQFKEPPSGWR